MFFINDVIFVNNYYNRVVKDFSKLLIITGYLFQLSVFREGNHLESLKIHICLPAILYHCSAIFK